MKVARLPIALSLLLPVPAMASPVPITFDNAALGGAFATVISDGVVFCFLVRPLPCEVMEKRETP
jgi:hypothetical protein